MLKLYNKVQLKGRQTQFIIEVYKQLITFRATSVGHLYNHQGTPYVAQLVEALRYKSERRGFDSRWCHWNFH